MVDGSQASHDYRGARMRHPATRELYSYWDRLRDGRRAPERREVQPADIGPVLSDTFILEVRDDASYPYRLAGTRVCAAFGRELKGENWLDGWSPRDRQALATLLRSIVAEAAGARMEFDGRNPRGQYLPFETVLLPLSNAGSGFSRMLGATVALDDPYWLHAQPVVELNVTGLHLLWPDDPRGFREDDPGVVDAPAHLPRALPLRRLRHLALYDGGRDD